MLEAMEQASRMPWRYLQSMHSRSVQSSNTFSPNTCAANPLAWGEDGSPYSECNVWVLLEQPCPSSDHCGEPMRCAQAAGPAGAVMQQQPAAAPTAPAPAANPTAASNEGAVDPNLLQNLLSQLQAPQQQAQVCCCKAYWACPSGMLDSLIGSGNAVLQAHLDYRTAATVQVLSYHRLT